MKWLTWVEGLVAGSEFKRNVATLSLGTGLAQVIPFLLAPVFSRLFLPHEYAVYALYFNIVSVLDTISTGRYELAAMAPKEDRDAMNMVAGGAVIAFFFSLAILPAVLFGNRFVARLLNNEAISGWLYLVPLVLFILGVGKMLGSWLVREKAFKASSINKISQRLAEGAATLTAGRLSLGNGLILGDAAGRFIWLLVSTRQALRNGFCLAEVTLRDIRRVLGDNLHYPLYNTIPALLNNFCTALPIFLVSRRFNEIVTGQFNLSRLVLLAPLSLITVSISQVLFQRITERRNHNASIRREIMHLLRQTAVPALLFCAVIIPAGPFLFSFVFGANWVEAGRYSQVLAGAFALQFVVSPLTMILPALGRVALLSAWQVFYFLLMMMVFLLPECDIITFLSIIVVIQVVSYGVCLLCVLKSISWYEQGLPTERAEAR